MRHLKTDALDRPHFATGSQRTPAEWSDLRSQNVTSNPQRDDRRYCAFTEMERIRRPPCAQQDL